jgi:two-component system, OmpR family, response regulator
MSRLRVLYVEDEGDIRLIAKASMEAMGGFEVKDCASGQEALDAAVEFDPEIIVLDVMMPGMTGPETLVRLREFEGFADKPFVFMTAKVQSDEIGEYMKLGAAGVIPKPFDVLTLSDQIRSYCAGARK